jgi:hypothetical protein
LKLVGKSRNGAKVHKVYDTAQTPSHVGDNQIVLKCDYLR